MFEELKTVCKKAFVSRADIETLTGGAVTEFMIRKSDTFKKGIKGGRVIGHSKCYPIDEVILWLDKHTEEIPERKRKTDLLK